MKTLTKKILMKESLYRYSRSRISFRKIYIFSNYHIIIKTETMQVWDYAVFLLKYNKK